jgi:cell division protein FtsL
MEAPGAIKTLMEQNALFAVMVVIIVVLARICWKLLTMHLKKLNADGDIKEIIKQIARDLTELKNRK